MTFARSDWEAFFSECPLPAFIADADGAVVLVNPMLGAAMGAAAQKMLGAPWILLVPEDERDSVLNALRGAGAPGGVCSWESRIEVGEGEGRWFRWWCRLSLEKTRVFVTACDVTAAKVEDEARVRQEALVNKALAQQRAMAEELQRSRDLLCLMLENVPMLLWTVDMNGVFTFVDGMGLKQIGAKPDEIVGQSFFERFRDHPKVVDSVWRALQGDNSLQTTEFGGVVWDNRYLVMRNKEGVMIGVAGLALDVTERVRTEHELRRRLDVIEWQRDEIRSISMPVLKIWQDVVAVPVIGTVTTERAAIMSEKVLGAVHRERAHFVILDVTGLELVDEVSVEGLLKVAGAVAMIGARAILAGIQPDMAIAVVEAGADSMPMAAFRNLRQAIEFCMARMKR